jgi:hypothetical protein
MPVDSNNVRVDSMSNLEVGALLDTRPGNPVLTLRRAQTVCGSKLPTSL